MAGLEQTVLTMMLTMLILVPLASCTNSSEGEGSDWCATHATQCPGDWNARRGSCAGFCGTGVPGASADGACIFAYCSVETGVCDNEEVGDPSISACTDRIDGSAGRWCATHQAQCPGDWNTRRGPCETFCGSSIPTASSPEACQFAYCSVRTLFCDNEQPGDAMISACTDSL